MKKFLAMILALCMVLPLAACGAKKEDEGAVYWLNFKPESKQALEELAAMYKEETGVKVKIVTAASGTYEETLTAEMDKEQAPTLFVVADAAAAREWSDYCLDLTGTAIANELNTDAYNVYDAGGKLCAIGYCYECYGIIVNTKLLQQAGYTTDDITDFASLKKVAEDITARREELGFAAFTSAGMADSSSWRFTGHLINLEYYYESVDAPQDWVYAPAQIRGTYMDNYRALYDLMIRNSTVPPAMLTSDALNAETEFINGEAVFFVNGSWEWSALKAAGFKAEDVAMIPYYCGVAGEEMAGLNCGTENCWAINANATAADRQATMDFMVWLVSDREASAKAVATFGAMPYVQAADFDNPFLADANDYAAAGHYTMPLLTNFQPNVNAYRAAAVSALNAYNANPTDANWADVETAFVAGWATQYQNANK